MRGAVLVVALLALPGCLSIPESPDPSLRLLPAGVVLDPLPADGAYGGTVPVSWRLSNPTATEVGATGIRFGPASQREAGNLSLGGSYPFGVEAAAPRGNATALVSLNFSSVHVRAFAVVGGVLYWSPEARIRVAGAPFGDPETRAIVAPRAEAGVPTNVSWSASNATGAVAELLFRPAREPGSPPGPPFVHLRRPLNASRAGFTDALAFPYPGGWVVEARLNLSGSSVATNRTEVVVEEPALPNVAFVAPPADLAPGESTTLRWRVNGPGRLGRSALDAGGTEVAGRPAGDRNFSGEVVAPFAGSLVVTIYAEVEGLLAESAPRTFPVVPRGKGTYVVAFENYPSETVAGGTVAVRFRVSGPAAFADAIALHTGNRSVPAGASPLSPTNYTGITVPPDSASRALPGAFFANLTAPSDGALYFRARVVVNGLAYWSEEGSVRVRPT